MLIVIASVFQINAMVNRAAGKGYENESFYSNIKFQFFGIENIHVMRSSLQKLLEGECSQPGICTSKFFTWFALHLFTPLSLSLFPFTTYSFPHSIVCVLPLPVFLTFFTFFPPPQTFTTSFFSHLCHSFFSPTLPLSLFPTIAISSFFYLGYSTVSSPLLVFFFNLCHANLFTPFPPPIFPFAASSFPGQNSSWGLLGNVWAAFNHPVQFINAIIGNCWDYSLFGSALSVINNFINLLFPLYFDQVRGVCVWMKYWL